MPDRLEILTRLMADHVEARRALSELEQEVDRIAQFRVPDAGRLAEPLRFFGHYMDRCHHPLEDMIYSALKRRHPALAREIDKIAAEHEEAAGLLAQLGDVTRDLLADPGASRAAFCRTARGLIAFQRHHMRREEIGLFAHAGDSLTADDWRTIITTSSGFTAAHLPATQVHRSEAEAARPLRLVHENENGERRTAAARKKIEGLSAGLRRQSGYGGR